jgi:diguanylate cyclase (GGDEF)-like protein
MPKNKKPRTISFSNKLTAFFVILVIIPTSVASLLLIRTNEQLSTNKVDIVLNQSLDSIARMYDTFYNDGITAAQDISDNPDLLKAWGKSNRSLFNYLKQARQEKQFRSVTAYDGNDQKLWKIGNSSGLTTVRISNSNPNSRNNNQVKTLELTTINPSTYLQRGSILVNKPLVLKQGDKIISSTWNPDLTIEENRRLFDSNKKNLFVNSELQDIQDGLITINDQKLEIRHTDLDTIGEPIQLYIVSDTDPQQFIESSPFLAVVFIVLIVLIGILLFAFRRGIQQQLNEMVQGAKRIGRGDFSQKVPVSGSDEMSQLADEFNKMSEKLQLQKTTINQKMEELSSQKSQTELAIRNLGQALASKFNRDKILTVFLNAASNSLKSESANLVTLTRQAPERKQDLGWFEINHLQEKLYYRIDHQSGQTDQQRLEKIIGKIYSLSDEPHLLKDSQGQILSASIANNQYILLFADPKSQKYKEQDKELLRYLVQQTNTSLENIELHETISQQALTDSLTKLHNRRSFKQIINQKMEEVNPENPLSLILLDIDNFKRINDTWGHDVGDTVIKYVAEKIKATARKSDYGFRYGGEEFILLLNNTALEQGTEVAERLRSEIETEIKDGLIQTDLELENHSDDLLTHQQPLAAKLSLTVSLGISQQTETVSRPSEQEKAIEQLVKQADQALYLAKESGKNCWKISN